jgi:glycerol kinase
MAEKQPTGYILAHDLGTTGNKSTLCGVDGHIVASCYRAYETPIPAP